MSKIPQSLNWRYDPLGSAARSTALALAVLAAVAMAVLSLQRSFRGIESYLQGIVTEYEDLRSDVARSSDGYPLPRLSKLSGFLARVTEAGQFLAGVSYHVDDIVNVLQAALLMPHDAPDRTDTN